MRRRKNHKRMAGNMSIIYISSIISLSFMGVGYGYWSNGFNIDMYMTVKTGFLQPSVRTIHSSDFDLDEGEWISYKFSKDDQTLYIDGEVYPSFNKDIPIKIMDEGSIPFMLEDINIVNDANIIELKEEVKDKYSRRSIIAEDLVDSFELNINPDNDNDKDKDSDNNKRIMRSFSQGEQDEISNLRDQIHEYDTIEDYDFEYELLFEQVL